MSNIEENNIIYDYQLNFVLGDDEIATLEIYILSNATTGTTTVFTPTSAKLKIKDQGSKVIGTGNQLRGMTQVTSVVYTVSDLVEEIHVQYKINGQLIVDHKNQVSEQSKPMIDIKIQFIES